MIFRWNSNSKSSIHVEESKIFKHYVNLSKHNRTTIKIESKGLKAILRQLIRVMGSDKPSKSYPDKRSKSKGNEAKIVYPSSNRGFKDYKLLLGLKGIFVGTLSL